MTDLNLAQKDTYFDGNIKQHNLFFYYEFNGKNIKFTITRIYPRAVRVTINDTIQAIWIPKAYFKKITKEEIVIGNIDWKLRSKDFRKKLELTLTEK